MTKQFTLTLFAFALVCLIASTRAGATIFTVNVANLAFSPANIPNVVVGDTIRWIYVSGFHDTTCDSVMAPGTTRPPGSAAWNALLTSAGQTFDYKVTVAGVYNYICTIHPVAMQASFTASSVLPVKLSAFKVANENNTPVLSWTTESEDNIDYFSVQKSKTGADYVEIGKVQAAGHSSVVKSYQFTDPNASTSDRYAYYILAIVDKEGKTEFSSVGLFKNKLNVSKLILSLSPNPVNASSHIMLKFNADRTSKMEVKILNMEGRLVLETTMQAYEGVNNGHLMLGKNITAGSYSISFELNGVREVHKLVIR